MKSIQPVAFIRSAALLAAFLLLPALAEAGIGIRSVTLVGITTNRIPCGGSATVTVDVAYRLTAGSTGGSRTVQLWESDYFGDDLLADTTMTVLATDPQKGTKRVTMTLSCSAPDQNCKCELSGNKGKDDEFGAHTIYAYCSNSKSASITVYCVKPGGAIAMSEEQPFIPGEGRIVPAAYVQDQPVATFSVAFSYDPTWLTLVNADFSPEVINTFQQVQIDTSTPGLVGFFGTNPFDVVVDPFLFLMDFQVDPNAPLFHLEPLLQTGGSFFLDQGGNPVDVAHAEMTLPILPFDNLPPFIDPLLLVLDVPNDQVIGLPGAVNDLLLLAPDPVLVGAGLIFPGDPEPAFFGPAPVQPDGSFLIPNAGLDGTELTAQIVAEDLIGFIGSTFTSPEVDFLGIPQHPQPAQFIIYDPFGFDGLFGQVLLSCTGNAPGFPLPNDGRLVPLVFDSCTSLGLNFGPLLQAPLDPLGIGTTPLIPFPPAPQGLELHVAAVVIDPNSSSFGTITNPSKFTTQ